MNANVDFFLITIRCVIPSSAPAANNIKTPQQQWKNDVTSKSLMYFKILLSKQHAESNCRLASFKKLSNVRFSPFTLPRLCGLAYWQVRRQYDSGKFVGVRLKLSTHQFTVRLLSPVVDNIFEHGHCSTAGLIHVVELHNDRPAETWENMRYT